MIFDGAKNSLRYPGSSSSPTTFRCPPRPSLQSTSSTGKWNCFFKWIKQHLRIKAFYGTSENAVKT